VQRNSRLLATVSEERGGLTPAISKATSPLQRTDITVLGSGTGGIVFSGLFQLVSAAVPHSARFFFFSSF
jgi:hypothetical protein